MTRFLDVVAFFSFDQILSPSSNDKSVVAQPHEVTAVRMKFPVVRYVFSSVFASIDSTEELVRGGKMEGLSTLEHSTAVLILVDFTTITFTPQVVT